MNLSQFEQEFGTKTTYYVKTLLKVEHLLRVYVLPPHEKPIDLDLTKLQQDALEDKTKLTKKQIHYGVNLLLSRWQKSRADMETLVDALHAKQEELFK